MTDRERAIAERLRTAADHIPVTFDVASVTDGVLSLAPTWRPERGRRLRWLPVAAAVVTIAAIGAVAVGVGVRDDAPGLRPAAPPVTIPASAPAPGSMAPHSDAPPAWVGELATGQRHSALLTGEWVRAAFAIESDDGFAAPITVSAFDGDYYGISNAVPIERDGQTLRSLRHGDWEALFTVGTPTIMVSGLVGTSVLAELADNVMAVRVDGALTVQVEQLPDGYVEIVGPHTLGTDVAERPTIYNERSDLAVNEVSEQVHPLLAAAGAGVDVAPVEIGPHTGWAGRASSTSSGPITFVIWSPEPGVVFEIDTTDTERSVDDLVALAATVRGVPIGPLEPTGG